MDNRDYGCLVAFRCDELEMRGGERIMHWCVGTLESIGTGLFASKDLAHVETLAVPEKTDTKLSRRPVEEWQCNDPIIAEWPRILVLLDRFRLIERYQKMKASRAAAKKHLEALMVFQRKGVKESALRKIRGFDEYFKLLTEAE